MGYRTSVNGILHSLELSWLYVYITRQSLPQTPSAMEIPNRPLRGMPDGVGHGVGLWLPKGAPRVTPNPQVWVPLPPPYSGGKGRDYVPKAAQKDSQSHLGTPRSGCVPTLRLFGAPAPLNLQGGAP